MVEAMEWKPTRQARATSGRRAEDAAAGERMARMEEQIIHLTEKADDGEKAMVRVHERLDDVVEKLGSIEATVSDSSVMDRKIDAAIASHSAEKQQIIDLRFQSIADVMARIEKSGEERLNATMQKLDEIKSFAVKIMLWIVFSGMGALGWILTYLFNHPDVVRAIFQAGKNGN